jgi:xylan 1,4-beta-xylosidase
MKFRFLFWFAIVAGNSLSAAATPITFDWFEYTGRDTVFETPLKPGEYRNPILAGFYPDPSVCRVGDDYYLVNSTFGYFPGIPIFHSRDLVHWEQLGHVIDRPNQLRYDRIGVTRGLFAPSLSYHDGTFYLVCTMVDAGGNFLVTAKNPAGPWSDPVWLGFAGIDPSLFFDDDGRAWLVNNGNPPENKPLYPGHRAIILQEFDLETKKLGGPRSLLVNGGADISQKPEWIEGPHLYKRGHWYYLCCAEGGTGDQHSEVIFRSESITGPFVPWEKNPILTQRDLDGTKPGAVTCTGHADLVIGPDGNWWATFLGCRPFAGKYWTTGRETFLLPVTWTDDDWPVILPPGKRVPFIASSPKLVRVAPDPTSEAPPTESNNSSAPAVTHAASVPLTGNFTWRDDFSDASLSPLWIMLRTSKGKWWALDSAAGQLALTPRADALSGRDSPAFLARRVQHARFEATTALAAPTTPGVSAGLAIFQNETHYFYLGIRRIADGASIFLERFNGKSPELVTHAEISFTPNLELRITGEEKNISFAYATTPDHWETLLANVDITPVTVQAAGNGIHFTGAVIGMHARIDP